MPDVLNHRSDWIIRFAEPNELNFIYSTWLKSYRGDSSVGRDCRTSVFYAEYPKVVDKILNKALTKILIACYQEAPELILSYLVYEPGVIHYAFTKEIYRNHGIAKSLFEKAFEGMPQVSFTHRTFTVEQLLELHQETLNFNPFKLYDRLEIGGEKHV